MNAQFVRRVPSWRSFMWVGVVGSLVTWAWAWALERGPTMLMLLVALSAVALAYRANSGNRWAIVGLMVAGFSMLLAGIYWFYLLTLTASGPVSAIDFMAMSVFPMAFAAVLLLGVVPGFRHVSAPA